MEVALGVVDSLLEPVTKPPCLAIE